MNRRAASFLSALVIAASVPTGMVVGQGDFKPEKSEEGGSGKAEPKVPEDLLQDEHLREEFGVNEFTAPSIKKLFGDLAEMGALPYEKLRRDIPKETPKDRVRVALSLGTLIADGFLMVHTEKIQEFEDVGRAGFFSSFYN